MQNRNRNRRVANPQIVNDNFKYTYTLKQQLALKMSVRYGISIVLL